MSLLEGYDEEEIKSKVRDIVRKVVKDVALQLRGTYDFETLIDIFDSWLKATGFPHRHNKDVEKNHREEVS
jgi:hypothetical protein